MAKTVSNSIKKILDTIRDSNICPEFTCEEIRNGTWKVTMKRYPMTVGQYIDENNGKDFSILTTKIYTLIDKLHSKGVFHGDLHAENIVLDPITMDVRIIDFEDGRTRMIDSIKKTDIKKIREFFDTEEVNTIDELIEYERNMWKYGYIDD